MFSLGTIDLGSHPYQARTRGVQLGERSTPRRSGEYRSANSSHENKPDESDGERC